jgi:hypothetical protein
MCGTNQEEFEDTKGVIRIRKSKKDKMIRYRSLLTSFNRIGSAIGPLCTRPTRLVEFL